MYQMTTKYTKGTLSIPNGLKVFQMATSYANILNSKDLQKLPRLEFWFAKKTSGNPAGSRQKNYLLLAH
jgi:hypothetical protein